MYWTWSYKCHIHIRSHELHNYCMRANKAWIQVSMSEYVYWYPVLGKHFHLDCNDAFRFRQWTDEREKLLITRLEKNTSNLMSYAICHHFHLSVLWRWGSLSAFVVRPSFGCVWMTQQCWVGCMHKFNTLPLEYRCLNLLWANIEMLIVRWRQITIHTLHRRQCTRFSSFLLLFPSL